MADPVSRREDLGRPIPGSVHSVSMALPLWEHVVGYEEKRPEVMNRLRTGYPRFVIHPLVQELTRTVTGEANALPFPSAGVAERCAQFLRANGKTSKILTREGVCVVATDQQGWDTLKAFWQHTGLIVSTRQAQHWLEHPGKRPDGGANESLRRQLAELYRCDTSDVLLFPTGMAAQYGALRVLQAYAPGRPTAQLGFPYVDTLKLQQKLGHGGHLLHKLDTVEADLEDLADRQPLAGCFCEVPGNPLLGTANLPKISPILRKRALPLVVDDVVATPYNIDVSPYADMVATSLTKFLAGNGEVMGGALILNPASPMHSRLKAIALAQHEDLLWPADAAVLDETVTSFPERMRRHNASGLAIAEKLRSHPAVEKVWYPKWEFSEAYEAVRRPGGGWGALVTFLPRNGENTSARIYDKLDLCKGPSLGTTFTLACPFTLLAHYTELEWAESCGVNRNLIRLSIGLEDVDRIWAAVERALS